MKTKDGRPDRVCACGFDFLSARMKGRVLESFAVIRDRDYPAVMRKESAVLAEKHKVKALRLSAKCAPWVGSLVRCPRCGQWLLQKPLRHNKRGQAVLLKTVARNA